MLSLTSLLLFFLIPASRTLGYSNSRGFAFLETTAGRGLPPREANIGEQAPPLLFRSCTPEAALLGDCSPRREGCRATLGDFKSPTDPLSEYNSKRAAESRGPTHGANMCGRATRPGKMLGSPGHRVPGAPEQRDSFQLTVPRTPAQRDGHWRPRPGVPAQRGGPRLLAPMPAEQRGGSGRDQPQTLAGHFACSYFLRTLAGP